MEREQAEKLYGPIRISRTANTTPYCGWDFTAVFDKLVDLDMPAWAEALGASEAEALETLLEQAEEHFAESLDGGV